MKNKNAKKFKFLEHTADVKFQAFGRSLEEVFSNSALAMFNSMSEDKIKSKIKKKIKVSGKDLENLLYNFLEELLILFDRAGFFLGKIEKIKISKSKEKDFKLEAEVAGANVEKENIEIHIDVKAVTYNEMFVKKEGNKYVSQVVLDV